jgi:uncharacterized membrane protein YhiD involved in acid resistance
MTLRDIFKSSFLENVSTFSALDMILVLTLSLAVGLFIFFVYKKTYRGVMYSASFGVSLIALSMITALVILAVTSNVILSLGMVGALSIVRFRTAIKEPLDIAFLFWAIAAGIVLGAGLIPLALLGSLFIGVILIVFVNKKSVETPYILVIGCQDDDAEAVALNLLAGRVKKYAVKSKTVNPQTGIELTAEIRLSDSTTGFVNEIAALPGIRSAVLVSYNGEYTS